jgi:acetylornithine deacetylase/succinyl-diaminopimelate desuccinylase-like protein
MSDTILSLLEPLVAIPSVTDDRAAVQKALDFLEQSCHPALVRKRITEDDKASLLIALEDTLDFDVLILTHVDVVPAPAELFRLRQDGDKLMGRGVADMKGSLSAGLSVLNEMASLGIRKKVGLLVVTDEEHGGKIAPYWINQMGLKAKVVLDPDAGQNINRVIEKSKWVWIFKLTAHGERAHGAFPWLGTDAIELLTEANVKLRGLFPAYSKANNPENKWVSTAHIGMIQGGEAMNTIAPSATAVWDFRLTDREGIKRIQSILDTLAPDVTYETVGTGDAVIVDAVHPMFQRYCDLIREKTGAPVMLDFANGATDARYFASMGALIIPHQPTGDDYHADTEWISSSALKTYADILREFLR